MKTKSLLLFIFSLLSSALVCANPSKEPSPVISMHESVPRRASKKLPDYLWQRPKHLLTDDQYYEKYIGKPDNKIKDMYTAEWTAQEKMLSEEAAFTPNYHFTGGFNPTPVREDKMRFALAQQAFRIRVDAMIKAYSADLKQTNEMQTVHAGMQRTLDKVRDYPVRLGSDPSAGELRMGYDVITDYSKIEYINAPIEGHLSHPALVGAITGSRPKFDLANLMVNTNFGGTAPRAEIAYPLHGQWITTSLSKQLSPQVSAAIRKRQPLTPPEHQHYYEVWFSYNF